jgi:2-C-methyl-D-erythritol 4-phosphate cytidylyltransferase
MATWAVVVAAGSGDRFGGPKQYEALGAKRVLDWSLFVARDVCDGIVLVVHPDRAADAEPGVDAVVAGGETRSASVRCGLAAVPDDAEVIVVHDAARPWASPALWARIIAAVAAADAAVPGVAVVDTLRERGGATVDRDRFVAVQTPQAFRAGPLLAAYSRADEDAFVGTDTASCVERYTDVAVRCVPGDAGNIKITFPEDLFLAERLLAKADWDLSAREPRHEAAPWAGRRRGLR